MYDCDTALRHQIAHIAITVCLRLAGAFAKFQIAPLHRRHTKDLAKLFANFPIERLAAIFGDENNVIFAIPIRVLTLGFDCLSEFSEKLRRRLAQPQ